ncbi:MAG: hypothetical protein AAB739_05105 [Patescibacteria group bacterium]
MEKPAEQPGTDLAELHARVLELTEMARVRREELREQQVALRKKQKEAEAVEERGREKKRLKDSFIDGANFAEWADKRPRGSSRRSDIYTIKIGKFREGCNYREFRDDCNDIEGYICTLRAFFGRLQDQFQERKKVIDDPKRGTRAVSVPSRCRVFPGSGTVINDCCGGVNGHERNCGAKNLQEFSLNADELKALRKKQDEELEELTREIAAPVKAIHAHMEGFIETILKSNPDTDALLFAVKVAMVAGADTFREFGWRQKVLGYLKTTVIAKIEEKLSTGADIEEEGIKEIERILNEVGEAVKQQVKK